MYSFSLKYFSICFLLSEIVYNIFWFSSKVLAFIDEVFEVTTIITDNKRSPDRKSDIWSQNISILSDLSDFEVFEVTTIVTDNKRSPTDAEAGSWIQSQQIKCSVAADIICYSGKLNVNDWEWSRRGVQNCDGNVIVIFSRSCAEWPRSIKFAIRILGRLWLCDFNVEIEVSSERKFVKNDFNFIHMLFAQSGCHLVGFIGQESGDGYGSNNNILNRIEFRFWRRIWTYGVSVKSDTITFRRSINICTERRNRVVKSIQNTDLIGARQVLLVNFHEVITDQRKIRQTGPN
jgi:hypothetical protein